MSTKVMRCSCNHKFQDQKYGKDNRVFNRRAGEPPKYRCTVCSKEN
jgi:hypothetical protein